MERPSVVVLGGYGIFGSHIAASLARHPELDLIIAGRSFRTIEKARRLQSFHAAATFECHRRHFADWMPV